MKGATLAKMLVLVLVLAVCRAGLSQVAPMGTAFTYQGRLIDANEPANGIYEFQFNLYDLPEDGNQLDGTPAFRGVEVVDGYFTLQLDFGSDVFNGDARWLEISVRPGNTTDPFTILAPRQEVTPTPYALYAETANNASYAETAGNTEGGIDGSGTSGYIAKFTGSNTIGNSVIHESNYSIGIGTTHPNSRLHIWKPSSSSPVFQLDTQKIVGPLTLTEKLLFDGTSINAEGTLGDLPIRLNPNTSGDVFLAGGGGQVGIGTDSPYALLDVISSSSLSSLFVQNTGTGVNAWFTVNNSAGGNAIFTSSNSSTNPTVFITNTGGGVALRVNGTVEINGTATVRGNIMIKSESTGLPVLELGEGLDYAEGFDVTEEVDIPPGTVLVIDFNNPGNLTVSCSPYDSKVAGIVAGGKGLGSGVRLGVGQFDHDVALAGRVFCNVDATQAAVRPGDLLTTSDTAGYAMKAADYDRARGAILGKAMQKLELGQKAQILVLVTLQ